MKKLYFILAICLLSCQKEECWTFTTTQTTSISPNIQGYPQTVKTETIKALPYEMIFVKLMKNKVEAKYEEKYGELLKNI